MAFAKKAAACIVAAAALTASGQVVINELYENPPGSGSVDAGWEYIELYGKPGMSLDGYIVVLIKGGTDPNGDDIPGPIPAGENLGNDEIYSEIDEAFSLDGLTLGDNGLLMIYNDGGGNNQIVFADPQTTLVSFSSGHIPSVDTVGNLANDTSSTYLIIRARPGGDTIWRKDTRVDVDYDGKTDFGFEIPVNGELVFGTVPPPGIVSQTEPYQIIDGLAWSHLGGKEYVRSSQQEISDTPGFNPDAVSRQNFFFENPMLGLRINSSSMVVPTRMADEEFIYGDMLGVAGGVNFDPARSKAPTDPNGDGFQDLDVTGYQLTPGGFNDSAGFVQFRFVRGDLNFDGVVNAADLMLFTNMLEGRLFDETEDILDEQGLPIPNPLVPGENLVRYIFQDRLAQAYLAAACLDPTDGVDGANAVDITPSDKAELLMLIACNPADLSEATAFSPAAPSFGMPDGILSPADFVAFVAFFNSNDLRADLSEATAFSPAAPTFGIPDGIVTPADFVAFVAYFNAGCPCTLPGCP